MRRVSAVLVVAALAVVGLAACGGSSNDNSTTAASTPASTTPAAGGAGGGSTVDISTPGGSTLAYDQKSVSAKAGSVTINFDNKEALQHDVAVADSSGKVLGQTDLVSSGTANATVNLQPGTYTFYCTVPGHKEAGMEGTLTVK
jgi:plastocyanin